MLLGVPRCPFAAVARVPCPGCGLTRATLALLHGHFGEAIRLHPLSPVVAPAVAGLLAYAGVVYVRTGRWSAGDGDAARRLAIAGFVLWALLTSVWVARFQGAFGGPVAV